MSSRTEQKAQHAEQSAEKRVGGTHESVSRESHESSSSSTKEISSTGKGGVGSGIGSGHDSTSGTGTGSGATSTGSHDHESKRNPNTDTAGTTEKEGGNTKGSEERNSDGFIPGEPLEKNHKASVNPSSSHTKDHDATTTDHEHSHEKKEGVGSKLKNAFHHDKKTT